MIKFGAWIPDIAAYGNDGATEAKNVVPTSDGFRPMLALVADTSALNLYCRGAFAAQANTLLSYNYAGTGTKLYQLVDGTWTDQSKASGTYALSDGDNWEFIKWGEKIIGVGGINTGTAVPPQVIGMGAAAATEFADLGGSPPQARHIAVVRDFIVMADLYESATLYPNRIRWSGVNDETEWTTSPAKQSDYQDLQGDGGFIQSVKGGQFGLIFQERSIWRMDYIGPPHAFSVNEILPGVGTQAKNSVVQYGNSVFFLALDGFKALVDGETLEHIGENKVDRWFFDRLDEDNVHRMVGAVDNRNKRVMWIYPGASNVDGMPNEALIFDMASGGWSRGVFDCEWIYRAYGEDYTLDGLDAVSASLDDLPYSLDSTAWVGGAISLSGFYSDHKSGRFDGSALDAVLETKEDRLSGVARTDIERVRPEVDEVGTAVTVTPGHRDEQSESVTWGGVSTAERDGNHCMRVDARYHRFRVNVTGGFERALGVSVVEGEASSEY